jgi:hypothetical protein
VWRFDGKHAFRFWKWSWDDAREVAIPRNEREDMILFGFLLREIGKKSEWEADSGWKGFWKRIFFFIKIEKGFSGIKSKL